jgi:hypothetical protein
MEEKPPIEDLALEFSVVKRALENLRRKLEIQNREDEANVVGESIKRLAHAIDLYTF